MARNQFVDALKLFLDTADSGELEHLAVRLKPYRIASLQVQRPDGARSIPVIVLDDGQTPAQTPPAEPYFEFGLPWSLASCPPGNGQLLSDMTSQAPQDYAHENGNTFGSDWICQLDQVMVEDLRSPSKLKC